MNKTPELTTPPDGQTTPADSAALTVVEGDKPETAIEEVDTEQMQREAGETLRRMGLAPRITRKMFAGKTGGKYLKRQICGRIALVFFANNLDQLALAQKKANILGRDKNLAARDRIAAWSVVAQCGMAIGNAGKVFMDTAEKLDEDTEGKSEKPKAPSIVQQFNFPQVAAPSTTALPPAISGVGQNGK